MFNKFGQMAEMMRQAGQMREAMREATESLARLKVTGEAGGGRVRVTITGTMEVDDVKIDPSLPGSVPINELEGMIFYAVDDALKQVREQAAERMARISVGVNIPGLDKPIGEGGQ